jgi:hypothetical protein
MKKIIVAVILALFACGTPPAPSAGESALPVDTLAVAMSIGQELGDSTCTFGIIQDALIMRDGRMLVLDRQSACIKVFDPAGGYLEQVSRRGGGPGELNMPWEFFQMPGGNVMVLEMLKQGFVVLDDSLHFQSEISHWTQNPPMQSVPLSDSTFASYKIDADMVGEVIQMNRRIVIYTVGEEDFDTVLWEDSLTATPNDLMENPSMFVTELLDAFCLEGDGEGSVYFSQKSGEEYAIVGWNASGEEFFRASLDLEPVPKTPEEIAEEKAYVTQYIQNMGGGMPFEFEPEPFRDMVVALGVGPDGNLWVQRGTSDTPLFDLFDASGNQVGQVAFPEEGWSWTFNISPMGILAWEADPADGFQRLYVLNLD